MDDKDVIIMILAAIALYLANKLEAMTEKWRIADRGWTVALMHIREHNVPLPTHEEYNKYLERRKGNGKQV